MRGRYCRSSSLAVVLLAVVTGCSGKSSTTTNPNPGGLTPTGTIQGMLVDRTTNDPIRGAVISIGVARATTDELGQFTLRDVPATVDALNHSLTGVYVVTIDMQRATNAAAATAVYPKISYAEAAVSYTSLNDTDGTTAGGGSGTNHDTPVTGIVTGVMFEIGKLASTISGVVATCQNTAAVGAGFTVQLVSGGTVNNASGNAGNVVATATTDASGAFSFTGVESLQSFAICAFNAAGTLAVNPCLPVTSPADGQTRLLSIEAASAPKACTTDVRGPAVTAVTPEPGSDIAPGAATTVTIQLDEAVDAANPLFSTTPGVPGNLYERVEVLYEGNKLAGAGSGNVAFGLAWNEGHDLLTVTFDTAPSGMYVVRLGGMVGLTDANLRAATRGVCPDDGSMPGAYGLTPLAGTNDCAVFFTTNGAPTAAAPAGLAVLNLNAMDMAGAPHLDWLPASGAKTYDVYRTAYQWPGYPVAATGALAATAEAGTAVRVATGITATEFTDASLSFVESQSIPLAYVYTVKSVNSDGIESATGVSVNVSDKVAPTLTSFSFSDNYSASDGHGEVVWLLFSELMDEGAAETLASYAATAFDGFATPALAGAQAVVSGGVTRLTLTFGDIEYAISAAGVCSTTVTASGSDDVQAIASGSATCVQAGTDNTLETAVAAGDAACGTVGTAGYGICAGADGVCNTVAAATDTQITTAGRMPKCVTQGPNGRIDVGVAGADYLVGGLSGLTIGTGVTDVAGNPVSATTRQVTITYPSAGARTIRIH